MTQPGSPEPFQLVIVKYGTRRSTRDELFLNYPLYGEPDAPMDLDYFFWVIVSSTQTIVVDCGFSSVSGGSRNRTMLIEPEAALRRLGIDAASVNTLIVTHAHYDHIGNLASFPNARLVIARDELAFWKSTTANKRQFAYFVEQDDLHALSERDDSIDLIDGSLEVVPGVVVTVVGGHTPGQAVVEFLTTEGAVLLASDAVHFYEELERDMPFMTMVSLPDAYDAFAWVRQRVETTGATLVTGHDAGTGDRFRSIVDWERGDAFVVGEGRMSAKVIKE